MIPYVEHSSKDKSVLYGDTLETNDYLQRDWGIFWGDGNVLQLCGIVSWVHTFVNAHQTGHYNWVHFTVCK